MKMRRSYTMGARAQAVEETRRRILDSFFTLANERLFSEISLDDIATNAGVSVQTVLRQFGSRTGLIEATMEHALTRVAEERATPIGDVEAAMKVIVDHYEQRGDTALLMLAQESSDPQVASITERGRRLHRTWVEQVFAPHVGRHRTIIDLLVVATDVYTWKLLRRDRGLTRAQTERRMKTLVDALLVTTTSKEG